MRKKFKATSVSLHFVLLIYASVIDFGKGHSPRPEVKHEGHLSSDGVKGGRYLSASKFPKERHSQFHFQPLSNQEILQVIDEGKVQSSDNDTGTAEPVSTSLVEIVEENSPNQAQKDDFKRPSQAKNSSHSSAIFLFPQHKVHTLQTVHRKPLVKLKQNSARVYPSFSKSKIFTRVSIPGKHRLFNKSHVGSNWTKLLLSRKFTSLKHNTFRESALQLSNNINVTDEARKRMNEMERNQASYRDILEAFISRMGLNVSSDLHPIKPSSRVGVPERFSHPNKGNTNLPPKKASLQRTSNQRGGYPNFSASLPENSLQSPTHIKESALQLSNNINVTDEAQKRINQMERNRASYRDILDAFISRMGLNVSSDLHLIKPSSRVGVPERLSHQRPSKTVLLNTGHTNLPPKKAFLQRTSNQRGGYSNFNSARKSTSLPANSLQSPTVIKESALQLHKNINLTDEARKRINQMERNQASYRAILEAFISRMGLNVSSDLHLKPSPHVGVPKRFSSQRPSKTVLLNRGSNLPPKKASLQRTANQRGGYSSFNIARKSTSLPANSLQSPTVIKEGALQLPKNINVTDEIRKGINQTERNQASYRDILEAFIARMGVNVSSDLHLNKPFPRVGVPEKFSSQRPSNTVLFNKGNNLPPKKTSLQRTLNQRGGYSNFSASLPANSLQSPTVIKESALHLSNNINVTDETRKQINEMERNQASYRAILEAFISRMGLNVSSDLHLKPSARVGVPEKVSSQRPSKTVLLNRGNTNLQPKKASLQRTSNQRGGYSNFDTAGKSTSLSANSLQSATVIKGVPEKKKKTSPLESEVFDSLSDKKFLNSKKKSTSNGGKKYVNNSPNLRILNSSLRVKDAHFLENIATGGQDKSALGTHPKSQVSQLSPSVDNQTKATTTQLNNNKSQQKNRNNVTGRDKSGLGSHPNSPVFPLNPSVNNTQTEATTTHLKENKSQDKGTNNVIGRDKSGLRTHPKSPVSPLNPSVNSTKSKGTTTQLKLNKSQQKNRNIGTGRDKSGLGTRPRGQVSPLSPSVNNTNTNPTTAQLKNNKTQDKSRTIATGREKSGLGTRLTSQVSPLSTSVNSTKANTTTTQLKNNKTQDNSGNISDYPKIDTKDKHLVNPIKSGSHNLVLAHARKNATYLNSTELSIKTIGRFTSSLDSNISLKHFSDLIKFFDSFNSSSDEKPTSNISTGGNSHISNKFKNGTRNRIISENLLRFLDFVHTKNYTNKRLEKGHTHSDHDFIADQIRKQLQMSIYRGWNKARKGRRLGSKKLPTSSYTSVKGKLTKSHDSMQLKSNDSLDKSKGDDFELNVLQMMKNVSQKELLKLEDDIIHALSSAKLWNLPQKHENQNPGQHQISPEKMKDKQRINRQHNKQELLSEKQLNYQQLNKQEQKVVTFKHRNPKVGQQQNQAHIQRNNKQFKQQIKDSNNGTALYQHESEQSHLQQTDHARHRLKKKNMSNFLESTTTDQNCSLLASVNTTKKSLNNGCNQTHSKSSPQHNGSKDFFSHSSNTSHAKTKALIKIAHALHNSASAQTRNNTLPLRTGDSTVVTKPGFNVDKDVDDTKNISVQFDRDSAQEPVNTESISEGTTGSGIVELTEFVDQVQDKENLTTKWSEWTPCSKTCGDAKRKRIEYRCTSSSQEIRDCAVSGLQHEACVFKPCPVDGRFTSWTRWSTCSRSCGLKGFSVRSRSCTAPKHGGQPCYGAGIDTRECNRKHCPVNGGLSEWSKFGLCSKSCGGGVRMRHRECNNPVPRYGGTECDPTDLFETQSCGNMRCPAKTLKRLQVADVDPKSLCDFNPCHEAGCLHDPSARCITDFECNPVFFNVDGDMLSNCKGMDSLFSRIPEVICSYNPCLSEKCWEIRDQCVVDLKCRPVFIGIDRRSIPPQCQVHATARVDRLRDQTWTKFFPTSRPVSVNLASDLMPSFTQLWYPVASSNRIEQFERVTDVNNYPLAFSRALNTSPTMANSKHTVQSLEQRPVTEVFIEKVPNGNQADDDDDDDDDADDSDNVDESNADEDDDDGNVFSDFDEDG